MYYLLIFFKLSVILGTKGHFNNFFSKFLNHILFAGGSSTLGGYGRGSLVGPAVGVCTGADLLRLGGPARGWYPRQRHRYVLLSAQHVDSELAK